MVALLWTNRTPSCFFFIKYKTYVFSDTMQCRFSNVNLQLLLSCEEQEAVTNLRWCQYQIECGDDFRSCVLYTGSRLLIVRSHSSEPSESFKTSSRRSGALTSLRKRKQCARFRMCLLVHRISQPPFGHAWSILSFDKFQKCLVRQIATKKLTGW